MHLHGLCLLSSVSLYHVEALQTWDRKVFRQFGTLVAAYIAPDKAFFFKQKVSIVFIISQ